MNPLVSLPREVTPMLIMLARVPVLGQVKSRLAKHIGQPQALRAHLELLQHNASIARASGLPFELHVAGNTTSPWFARFVEQLAVPLRQQGKGDIGEKMRLASDLDAATYPTTASILIGSDCGGLSVEYLLQAAQLLADVPVVLGAAEDGGYVLIGQRQPYAELFSNIGWGTEQVAALTRCRAAEAGLAIAELPLQWDVDGVADWRRWQNGRADRRQQNQLGTT